MQLLGVWKHAKKHTTRTQQQEAHKVGRGGQASGDLAELGGATIITTMRGQPTTKRTTNGKRRHGNEGRESDDSIREQRSRHQQVPQLNSSGNGKRRRRGQCVRYCVPLREYLCLASPRPRPSSRSPPPPPPPPPSLFASPVPAV